MTPAVPPNTTFIQSTGNILWSDGSVYTGYILAGLSLPNNSAGNQYASVNLWGVQPKQQLPLFTKIPIIEGVINNTATLFLSNQIEPPSTRYVFYWFDNTDTQIYPTPGSAPSLVSVLTIPYTISQPTLQVPGVPTTIPAPQSNQYTPNTGTAANYYVPVIPGPEVCGGVIDGINTVFTISRIPALAVIIIDGQIQTVGYTLNGLTVTFETPPVPGPTASVNAWLF